RTNLVEQVSWSYGWRPARTNRKPSVSTSAWDFGHGVRSANTRPWLPATSRRASFSRRRSRSSTDYPSRIGYELTSAIDATPPPPRGGAARNTERAENALQAIDSQKASE